MDLMGQWLLGMQGPNSASGKGLAGGRHRHPVLPDRCRAARARRPTRSAASTAGSSPRPRRPRPSTSSSSSARQKYAKEAAATGAYIPVFKGAEAAITDPLFKRPGRRSRRDDLPPELFRSGSRSLGRARHQRHVGRGRRRRNEAGSRRRRDPGSGRPAVARALSRLAGRSGRGAAARARQAIRRCAPPSPATARRVSQPGPHFVDRADHLRRARPADAAQRLGDRRHLPAACAAALHHLRRAADGRGGLVQFLQLERLRPAGKIHRPQELLAI